ncbi:hypothetical protein [Bythopirellula polymerisocia]|uniref:Uncharacterized protein n=1 Tax=Bythopirellula polymerisocia TaxID=2528003 RepID=A0A5C6CZJ5_9BACT|nr:hypothetical protein [Bythopirellula polymerisocia]TWU30062.1 hypothetical protein Pla144_08480 [Bythopirellula polymerisocia]
MRYTLHLYLSSLALALSSHGMSSAEPSVQQATHTEKISTTKDTALSKHITFSQQPTRVGDRVVQRVGMELELRTVIEQAGQVASDSKTAMRSRQEREIEVLEVTGGQALRAKVFYPLARQMSPENPQPDQESAQVVEGKSYMIVRDQDQLIITDSAGAIPTREEFEVVLKSMENFGKPNPLAEFLLARQIQIGDTLNVPLEIAADMMGFSKMGDVRKFELRLDELRTADGRECAVFTARIATAGNSEAPLHVVATGSVAIEIATSRTIEATLKGPVTMALTENGIGYRSSGELLMAVHSYYPSR